MATRRRRRRGHPKGKAWGFHGLRPASTTTTKSSTQSGDTSSATQTTTSATSS
jgi:hypothetical protein